MKPGNDSPSGLLIDFITAIALVMLIGHIAAIGF